MGSRSLVAVWVISVALAPVRANADEPSPEAEASQKARTAAKRMARVGKAAYKSSKWDDAVLAFTAAYEAVSDSKYLYNIARCHEKAGNLFDAMSFYQRYLKETPDATDREAVETVASFLELKLEKKYAHLTVTSVPTGADLRVGDGAVEVETPWTGWLQPGRYGVWVSADGYETFKTKLKLKAGDKEVMEAKLTKPPPPPVAEAPARPAAEAGAASGPDLRAETPAAATFPPPSLTSDDSAGLGVPAVAAFVVAGVALAGFAALGAMHGSAKDDLSDALDAHTGSSSEAQSLAERANTLGLAANVSLGIALAAGAVGGALAWSW